MTQRDLALRVGTKRQHISEIERGRVNLSITMVNAIARALNMSNEALLAQVSALQRGA